jgi:hypothetical protein
MNDADQLFLLEKYFAAHRRRGTTPHPDTRARYIALLLRVNAARVAA